MWQQIRHGKLIHPSRLPPSQANHWAQTFLSKDWLGRSSIEVLKTPEHRNSWSFPIFGDTLRQFGIFEKFGPSTLPGSQTSPLSPKIFIKRWIGQKQHRSFENFGARMFLEFANLWRHAKAIRDFWKVWPQHFLPTSDQTTEPKTFIKWRIGQKQHRSFENFGTLEIPGVCQSFVPR